MEDKIQSLAPRATAVGWLEDPERNVERCDATIRYDRPGVQMAEHVCGLPAGHWELGHQCYVRGCDAEWRP